MSIMSNLWIGCKQATFLHEKRKEGQLSASERVGLSIHLLYCRFCRAFIKQVEALSRYARKMQVVKEGQATYPEIKKAQLQAAFDEALKKL